MKKTFISVAAGSLLAIGSSFALDNTIANDLWDATATSDRPWMMVNEDADNVITVGGAGVASNVLHACELVIGPGSAPGETSGRVVALNLDPTEMQYSLAKGEETAEGVLKFFRSVSKGGLTHFFVNPNAHNAAYDSKVWEPIWAGLDDPNDKGETNNIWCVNAKKLFDAGIDPYRVWIARCREKGVSNAWFTFYNRVVAELKKTHPHLRFATVAYQGFRDAPTCPIKEAEFVEYALHSRSHVHLLGDPRNEENVREVGKLAKWFARKDVKVGLYTYENDSVLAHHTFQPIFSLVNETVDYAVAHGVVTILPEITLGPAKVPEERVWSVQNRTMELFYAWKMWDASLTVDGFLDDLTRNAYGPAAPQLKEYFKLLDAAWGGRRSR